ncbi:MAG TPA: guanylate kinase [Planctomycetes bacterium]|nr:guanylate kinase [Planctomycetota bacterium]HIK81434.1 guanylate kinase [Planctomycetota bacterium]
MTVGAGGILVVLSGPSGVGKTAVSERLVKEDGIVRAITTTTRAPRGGEQDGVDYHFLDRTAFERQVAEGGFLEHAEVHGNLYGSPKVAIEKQRLSSRAVLLLIDVQGAELLRSGQVDMLTIFLEPPGEEELKRRIAARGDKNDDMIDLRLRNALSEIAEKNKYDHCIVNDDLEDCVEQIDSIIEAELRSRGQ